MKVITLDAVVVCTHRGTVKNEASQSLVRIDRVPILVENDPESRAISLCPNIGATIKPCTSTLKVEVGYSTFVSIDGDPICLDTVHGHTDGTPPQNEYLVQQPGQELVESIA